MNAVIMFGLIVIICLVGIFAGRSVSSASQWANGGKNLTWATVGLLLVTFQIGGTSTIGSAQYGYTLDCVFEIRNKHIGFVSLIIYRETKLYAL